MHNLIRDIRYALKLLQKDRGFLLAALLTLTLCIGANSALFSVVRSVLIRPLPFPESERAVTLYNSYPNANVLRTQNGVPDWYDRQRETTAFEELALYRQRGFTIGERGSPERITGMEVSPSFFRLLRIAPHQGRIFLDEEGEPGNELKAVLSWGLWQSRFGGEESGVGQDLRINGTLYRVVGVMPRDFLFRTPDARIWVPLAFTPEDRSDERRHSNNYDMIGRLRAGVTVAQAQQQIDALNRANLDRFPLFREILINAGFHTVVAGLRDDAVRDLKETLILLQAGVLVVLLIGCANIANLVLVRASGRVRELATRSALGAGQGRLVRQLLTESAVLGVLGGILGLVAGRLGLVLATALGTDALPRGMEIRMDVAAAACTLVLATAAGLAFGVLPVLYLRRTDLSSVFRAEGRTGSASKGALNVRGALVSTQVAIAFALLITAGLILTSFVRTLAIDPGFHTTGVLTAAVSLPVTKYPNDTTRNAFVELALERIRALPGVQSVAAADNLPLTSDESSNVITPEGHVAAPGESPLAPYQSSVSPDYFETMGMRMVDGRSFHTTDRVDTEPVVIIDEWLARRYWSATDPIGKRLFQGVYGIDRDDEIVYRRIIGVVGNVRFGNLAGDQTEGHYYIPLQQIGSGFVYLIVRSNLQDPVGALAPMVRAAVSDIDPDLPLYDIETMGSRFSASLNTDRARAVLLALFASIALFLAAVGIYGVLAYAVSLRKGEIGVRMALGSSGKAVFALILRQGLTWVGLGLLVGVAGSLALGRLIQGLLFNVQPTDPSVFLGVAVLLGIVAGVACVLPARRAARVEPLTAMRE